MRKTQAIMFSKLPRPKQVTRIHVKQLGLATGKVVLVRRLHGKSNPLKIEVQYVESD